MCRVAALFRFEDEVIPTVEVDEVGGGSAVKVMNGDGLVKDVGVEVVLGACGIRARDFQEVAEFGEEKCVIGTLGGGRLLPAFNEARS